MGFISECAVTFPSAEGREMRRRGDGFAVRLLSINEHKQCSGLRHVEIAVAQYWPDRDHVDEM